MMFLNEYLKMKEIESHINNIICETFKSLYAVYPKAGGESRAANIKSRIIFPPYSGSKEEQDRGELRVSEQELRFTFVEKFAEYCDKKGLDYLYSVEKPTNKKYFFSDGDTVRTLRAKGEEIEIPCMHNNGSSANIDLVIHGSNGERLCLIEFKANNPAPDEIGKDLVKLTNKEEYDEVAKKPIPRYFIGMVKSSQPKETRENILEKIYNIKLKTKDELNSETVHIIFHNIHNNEVLFTDDFKFAKAKQ